MKRHTLDFDDYDRKFTKTFRKSTKMLIKSLKNFKNVMYIPEFGFSVETAEVLARVPHLGPDHADALEPWKSWTWIPGPLGHPDPDPDPDLNFHIIFGQRDGKTVYFFHDVSILYFRYIAVEVWRPLTGGIGALRYIKSERTGSKNVIYVKYPLRFRYLNKINCKYNLLTIASNYTSSRY